jgi:hypothetical protein
MNARFYLPGVNRFLSADTIVPDPADPQSYNRYAYSYNSPVKYQDPTGHKPTDGCEYEGCSLPNSLNPDETWIDTDGQYYGNDPKLAEKYPGFYSVDAIGIHTAIHAAEGKSDTQVGLEYIYNRHSKDITLFLAAGFGGGLQAGATEDFSIILIGNIDNDNLNYSGNFKSVSLRAANGIGGNVGYAWVPGDNPFAPEQAYSETYGATTGRGGGLTVSLVEYIPIVTTNLENHEVQWHTYEYLYDPAYPYGNGYLTGGYDLLMRLIEQYEQ